MSCQNRGFRNLTKADRLGALFSFGLSDWPSAVLLFAIVATSIWIVLNPLSQTVREVSLQRFHLANRGFAQWAILQPVPTMYNFENRYWVSERPLSEIELARPIENVINQDFRTRQANHFPARLFTFGDSRKFYLENRGRHFLYLSSRYRGNELKTVFEAVPTERGYQLHRGEWGRE